MAITTTIYSPVYIQAISDFKKIDDSQITLIAMYVVKKLAEINAFQKSCSFEASHPFWIEAKDDIQHIQSVLTTAFKNPDLLLNKGITISHATFRYEIERGFLLNDHAFTLNDLEVKFLKLFME